MPSLMWAWRGFWGGRGSLRERMPMARAACSCLDVVLSKLHWDQLLWFNSHSSLEQMALCDFCSDWALTDPCVQPAQCLGGVRCKGLMVQLVGGSSCPCSPPPPPRSFPALKTWEDVMLRQECPREANSSLITPVGPFQRCFLSDE